MKLLSGTIIASAMLCAATLAQADSTREEPAPKPAAAGVTLASVQQKLDAGDYRGAIPLLTDIIKTDPNNADALNLMGFSLRNTGQNDLALQYYNKALALKPKHLGANEYLGELYVELGQMDKAKERLAVLQGACGNCDQEVHLAAAIAKGPGTKAGSWR